MERELSRLQDCRIANFFQQENPQDVHFTAFFLSFNPSDVKVLERFKLTFVSCGG